MAVADRAIPPMDLQSACQIIEAKSEIGNPIQVKPYFTVRKQDNQLPLTSGPGMNQNKKLQTTLDDAASEPFHFEVHPMA